MGWGGAVSDARCTATLTPSCTLHAHLIVAQRERNAAREAPHGAGAAWHLRRRGGAIDDDGHEDVG